MDRIDFYLKKKNRLAGTGGKATVVGSYSPADASSLSTTNSCQITQAIRRAARDNFNEMQIGPIKSLLAD